VILFIVIIIIIIITYKKLSLCLINWALSHEYSYIRGSGGIAPSFLTSAVDGGKRLASRPCRFIPEEKPPGTHRVRVWSRSGRYGEEKNLAPPKNRTPALEPAARRYTDWAIPYIIIIIIFVYFYVLVLTL
jgi:hypothetical protein